MASIVPLVLIYNSSGATPHILLHWALPRRSPAKHEKLHELVDTHAWPENTRESSHTCTRVLQSAVWFRHATTSPGSLASWQRSRGPPPRWWQRCGRADKSLRHPSTCRCCSGTRAIPHSRELQIHKGTRKRDDILRPRPLVNTPGSGVLLAHLST